MSTGATREVTLVVRVQGPTGVSSPSGIGSGGIGGAPIGGGFSGGGGGIGGGGRGVGSRAGPMPAFGSSPESVGSSYGYGIPGGGPGGGFRSRGGSRAPFQPPERTPVFHDISYIPGGGGGSGFRSLSALRGAGSAAPLQATKRALSDISSEMNKVAAATARWHSRLGAVGFEMLRLVTWNRQITVGTFAAAEAQRQYGVPLVSAAGMGLLGGAAAAGITAAADLAMTGGAGLAAMGTRAGRAGFMDSVTQRLGFRGGREQALIQEQNLGARSQINAFRDFSDRAQFGAQSIARRRFDVTNFRNAARGDMAGLGLFSYSGEIGRLQTQASGLERRRRSIAAQLQEIGPGLGNRETAQQEFARLQSGNMRTSTGGVLGGVVGGVGGLFLGGPAGAIVGAGLGAGGGAGLTRAIQMNQYQEMQVQRAGRGSEATQQVQFFASRRAELSAVLGQQEETARAIYELSKQELQERQQYVQREFRVRQQIVKDEERRLSQIQGARTNVTFGAAGFSDAELRSATKRLKSIQAGGGKLPRGDELSGALGFLVQGLGPTAQAQMEAMYLKVPAIAGAIGVTGLNQDIAGAQGAVEEARKNAEQFRTDMNKEVQSLQDAVLQAFGKVTAAVHRMTQNDIEQEVRKQVLQLNNAAQNLQER